MKLQWVEDEYNQKQYDVVTASYSTSRLLKWKQQYSFSPFKKEQEKIGWFPLLYTFWMKGKWGNRGTLLFY